MSTDYSKFPHTINLNVSLKVAEFMPRNGIDDEIQVILTATQTLVDDNIDEPESFLEILLLHNPAWS